MSNLPWLQLFNVSGPLKIHGLGFQDLITVDDVLESKLIAYPFHLLECCLVTDGGGALILTLNNRAKDFPQKPVFILGCGESVETPMISQMEDLTSSRAFRVAGPAAMQQAGVKHSDVDHLMVYDAFAHLPIYGLEDLGFCKPGEAPDFIWEQNTAPGGKLPMNTNEGRPVLHALWHVRDVCPPRKRQANERNSSRASQRC